MAISVRAVSTASNSPVSTLSVARPTGTTTGDLVIVFGARNAPGPGDVVNDNNGSTPFTKQRSDRESGNGAGLDIFYRRIQSGDPSSYSFTYGGDLGASTFALIAVALQDPHASTVFDVVPDGTTLVSSSNDGGSINAASVTTSSDGAIHFIVSIREGTGGHENVPSGYTATNNAGALQVGLRAWYKIITTAGSTGAQTLTASAGSATIIQSFAIENTAGTQYTSSPSGIITHAGSLSAFIKLPKYTVKIG